MNFKAMVLILSFFIMLLSCNYHYIPGEQEQPDLVAVSGEHLAFPDLVFYKGSWYVTFRVSDAHVNGTYSNIKVMKSTDFISWQDFKVYEYPGFDVRDPKFSLNEVNDVLYLHFHAASLKEVYGQQRKNIYLNFSEEIKCKQPTSENFNELKLPQAYQFDWLWRPIWKDDKIIVGGYRHNQFRIYQYDSINAQPVILKSFIDNGTGETTIRYYKNQYYLLSRKKGFGTLNTISNPEFKINWDNLFESELAGPNFVIRNDTVYLGGRVNSTTSIYAYPLNNKNLQLKLQFVSKYTDCAYPGMFIKDNIIYGVYYTVSVKNEGFQIKTFKI